MPGKGGNAGGATSRNSSMTSVSERVSTFRGSTNWPSRIVLEGDSVRGYKLLSGSEDLQVAQELRRLDPRKHENIPAFVRQADGTYQYQLVQYRRLPEARGASELSASQRVSAFRGSTNWPSRIVLEGDDIRGYKLRSGAEDVKVARELQKLDPRKHENIPAFVRRADGTYQYQLVQHRRLPK